MLYLIKPKYLFSQDLYLSIREAFWKYMTWCKLNISDNADKLRYIFLKSCASLAKHSGLLEPIGKKPLGFIHLGPIDGACL